ncbi:hypothetical protein [Salinicoccus roseus]|uniref:Uncharacterized protein n=1 Tax=Salinicoccus roseus TaxID=45670 RepID=A0A265E9J0_9STAP|nr:hypothetical protein [Salinicoccus roseus]OZT78259.1 hypothetical protein CFN03_02990 [Salinicoccus roseus]
MIENFIAHKIEMSFNDITEFSGRIYLNELHVDHHIYLKKAVELLNNKRGFPYMICLLKDGRTIEFCVDILKEQGLPGIGNLCQEMYDDKFRSF